MAKIGYNDDSAVVIIGSGAGGGTLANELCQKGIKVVVLEAGAMQSNASFINDEWKSFAQLAWLDPRTTSGSFRLAKDFPGLPAWICKTVGGTTTHWAGASLRFQEREFKVRSEYGQLEGANLMDWPLTLKEMEPWYAKAEDKMGVTRTNGIPGLPGNNNFKVMYAGATKLGYKEVHTGNMAINSQPRDGRGRCLQLGFCFQGCKSGAKWSTLYTELPKADATGNLEAFLPELQEPPAELNYLNWFPSAGLTWQVSPQNTLALNYGRRINRPDYNVLNPFNNQVSQLSYEKGNPFLRPEIVNNLELGYTLAYRYNFKLAYSRTTDQITRLIAPDEEDPRAGFITWANLSEQTLFSFNASAPVQISKGWNAYFNLSASHLDNQADFGEGAVVDLQAFTYSIYQQHTISLPADIKGEVSGYYSGPGVWGGVFEYESSWSLNLGLQRKFLQGRLNARLSVNDIFYQTGWDGVSNFDGLTAYGSGRWDSRRASLSLSYQFGNENVRSRKRKAGLEEEAGRVGE